LFVGEVDVCVKGINGDFLEGGFGCPMLWGWPEKLTGDPKTDHVSAFWDMMPTIAEITGFPISENLDGISFLPVLTGNGIQKKHETLYWEFHEMDGRQALISNDWKLVRYHVFPPEKTTTELYNLRTDVGEEKNVADEHRQLVKEMIGIMSKSRIDSDIFPFRNK